MTHMVPCDRGLPDFSPLFVDPANGTRYSAVLTPAMPRATGHVQCNLILALTPHWEAPYTAVLVPD